MVIDTFGVPAGALLRLSSSSSSSLYSWRWYTELFLTPRSIEWTRGSRLVELRYGLRVEVEKGKEEGSPDTLSVSESSLCAPSPRAKRHIATSCSSIPWLSHAVCGARKLHRRKRTCPECSRPSRKPAQSRRPKVNATAC